jgi:hypothetical protein
MKKKHYSFDINQDDVNFYWLLANKMIKIKEKHKQMTDKELKVKNYC